MKKFLALCFIIISFYAKANNDSVQSRLQISVITCSPGQELYSLFGHTAIRVVDTTMGTDYFFNYGTFDFDDPNFIPKFVRGKLDYYLNIDDGNLFFRAYAEEKRTITEQVLHLSNQEKINIYKSLIENIDPKNKYYKYDFLFDNCTTRARDILLKNTSLKNNISLVADGTTFRQMLYVYLDSANMCWSKLGIDILLGSNIDVAVSKEQSSFLPDYLMLNVNKNNANKKVIESIKTYNDQPIHHPNYTKYLPLIIFGILAFIVALAFVKQWNKIVNFYALLNVFLTGIIGCLLIFMWLGTDHKSCANNYNLLWALPTNIFGGI